MKSTMNKLWMRPAAFAIACALTLSALATAPAYAWGDQESGYSRSDIYRDNQARENADAERYNREADRRTEDFHRRQEAERQERHRQDEQRSYMRLDKDGSQSFCTSSSASTTCF